MDTKTSLKNSNYERNTISPGKYCCVLLWLFVAAACQLVFLHTGALQNIRAGVNVGSVANHCLHQLHVVHGDTLWHGQNLGDENGNADLWGEGQEGQRKGGTRRGREEKEEKKSEKGTI